MRLIILPLSVERSMLYCQKTLLPLSTSKPRIDDRLAARFGKTWAQWSKSDTKWKKMIVKFANNAVEGISYDEWGLKTVPPRNAYLRRLKEGQEKGGDKKDLISIKEFDAHGMSANELEKISVIRPSIMTSQEVNLKLDQLIKRGLEHHKKYFWYSAIGAPLTLPFALLPVLPNIPGFYLLFRAWSNFKALEGAKHLSYLKQGSHLNYETNEKLNDFYLKLIKANEAAKPEGEVSESVEPVAEPGSPSHSKDKLILDEAHVDELVEILEAEELKTELQRAIRQVKKQYKDNLTA